MRYTIIIVAVGILSACSPFRQRGNVLYFENAPLSVVALRFNGTNDKHIRLADVAAGQLRITGRFKIDEPDEFVQTIRDTNPDWHVWETQEEWIIESSSSSRVAISVDNEPLSAFAARSNVANRQQVRFIDVHAGQKRIGGPLLPHRPRGLILAIRELYPDLDVREAPDGWTVASRPDSPSGPSAHP